VSNKFRILHVGMSHPEIPISECEPFSVINLKGFHFI
jgi:hypothetical protein